MKSFAPRTIMLILALAATCLPAFATTKGLNQIVTPDIQPTGVLSISAQAQNAALGNSKQLQLELGITKHFEVAVFQGFEPGKTLVSAEYALIQRPSFLLSAGLLGVQNRLKTQPFVEGGYYRGKGFVIAGIQEQESTLRGVYGVGYWVAPKVLATADYISGPGNFSTAGVTLTLTPNLTFNPAVYISNDSPHRAFGYGVLSWNIKVW